MIYYKIQNKAGLFSDGGARPSFKKIGKIWPIGQLKLHLRLIQENHKNFDLYNDCELIEFTEVTEPAKIKLRDIIEPLEKELVILKLQGKI